MVYSWSVHNCHCILCVNSSQNPGSENWLFIFRDLVRSTDLAISKRAVWLQASHRKCFPGSIAVSGWICGSIASELRAHGHASPWSPNGSAPQIARASDARIWNQTAPIGASDSENDSECKHVTCGGPTCCAASRQPFSGVICRFKMGAKSISMEKSDFFNLISGSVLFLYFWWNCKKTGIVFDNRWLCIQWLIEDLDKNQN